MNGTTNHDPVVNIHHRDNSRTRYLAWMREDIAVTTPHSYNNNIITNTFYIKLISSGLIRKKIQILFSERGGESVKVSHIYNNNNLYREKIVAEPPTIYIK